MPWKVLKRDCKQADGKPGGYVVVKEKSGGSTEQSSCHTSKEKAQGSIASRNMSEGKIRFTKKQLSAIIREIMELDLEVGDVILTGKFKNKRKVVKTFGKDDLGQPTINGTKALNFRIEKLMPKDKWSKKSKEALEFAENVDESKMKITKRQLRRLIREVIG